MKHALGIDIGGTKIALGVVAYDGRILAQTVIPTDARQGFDSAVQRMRDAARAALGECGVPPAALAGVGVGCTGPVNPRTGVIDNPHTLPGWEGRNLISALSNEMDLPVWLENDADAAALGEYHYGAGEGADRMVMLTFGTGVGGAILLGGQIYRGAAGEHPELGHLPVLPDGPVCYCGRNGCVESLASGPALTDAGRALGFADAAGVFAAAASGDARAAQVLADARQATDAAIWGVLHSFLPGRIVLGGGLVEAQPDFFLDAARATVDRARLLGAGTVTVAPASRGNLAGVVGAARWAIDSAAASRPSQPVLPS
ncbi:MAG: Glucokinase [Verrucomicrobiota bacterium]